MREGVDGHVLNAAMMNLLRVDCGKTNELIQAGGFYRWQEENKDSLRLMAVWMKEVEYAALMVSSMMASAAKQGNKERYQEKEGSGERDGSFIDLMDPDEAKRYENYWRQGSGYNVRVTIDDKQVDLIFDKVQGGESTRQRLYTVPGERSIKDVKLGENGEVYIRETIFDEYGRRIGNNDYTNHGRPDIPEHTIPHYHQNPAKNPSQHGSATPGLHPDTPQGR